MLLSVKDKEDFSQQLKSAGKKLVVIDFYASWCGPCKKIASTVEELATQHMDEVVVLKVNVDECEDVATDYNVSSMPQFFFIKNGKVVDSVTGASNEKLNEAFKKHLEVK